MSKPPLDQELHEIVTFARGIARSAGRIALASYGHANPRVKYDESLVTEADLAVQEHIRKEVQTQYPDHHFLGEEAPSRRGEGDCRYIWVVDPVDGTAAFSRGYPIWGVSIAVLRDDKPVVGVFFMPATSEMYSGLAGSLSLHDDSPIEARVDETLDNESLLLTYSRFHNDYTTSFPGKVRSLGSTAAHICYVARGAAWGAVLNNVHIWDVTAAQVILEAAGGEILDLDGNPFDPAEYLESTRIDRPLLAAAKGQHQAIREYLDPR